jgi:hypothetical protein
MNQYLAGGSSNSSGGNHWISTAVVIILFVVFVGTPIVGPIVVHQMRKIRDPVVTGTA